MTRRTLALVPFALALLVASVAPAVAGDLCGRVRDGQTGTGVARATLIVRTPDGVASGLEGVTDATGAFCVKNVLPGTYDLEVRSGEYQIAYLRSVSITGATEIEVPAVLARVVLERPAPNPARERARLTFTLPRAARGRIQVFDADGRFIRGFGGDQLSAGPHSFTWDLRDRSGRSVPAGNYFILLEADQVRRVQTLTRVR